MTPADTARAAALFPHSLYLQQRWLAAIAWLRRDSTPRWILDGGPAKWQTMDEWSTR